MIKLKKYILLDEVEFLDLLDEQMKTCNCRYCHAQALLGKWKTEIN